jgi:mono/diheme cytochrome c family protein
MWLTNLKVFGVVAVTLGLYTLVANYIPQVASEVPEELAFTGEVDVAQLVAAGQDLYEGGGGCTACHGTGARAPNLLTDHAGEGPIGQRCGTRVPGQDCKTYIHEAMVNPNAFLVPGFDGIMPDASRTLSNTQIWALVAYMESIGGEVTVSAEDLQSGEAPGEAAGAAGAPAPAGAPGGTDPVALLDQNGCIGCHQLEGRGAPLGPPLDGIGGRISAERIRRGILDPGVEAAAGFEAMLGIMPSHYGDLFSAAQLEAMVQYLSALR